MDESFGARLFLPEWIARSFSLYILRLSHHCGELRRMNLSRGGAQAVQREPHIAEFTEDDIINGKAIEVSVASQSTCPLYKYYVDKSMPVCYNEKRH